MGISMTDTVNPLPNKCTTHKTRRTLKGIPTETAPTIHCLDQRSNPR